MSVQNDSAKGGLDLASRHVCNCGKSYIRKEHLTRHQASHNGLAFACDKCHRQFSRKDLLRRHVLLHEVRNSRTAVSCDTCSTNKTKCSGGPSCSLCARRGVNCTFSSRMSQRSLDLDVSKFVHASSSKNEDLTRSHTTSAPRNPHTQMFHGAGKGDLWANLSFFRNLTIVPTQRTPGNDFQLLGEEMGAVYNTLTADCSSLNEALHDSPELRSWVAETSASYFEDFHIRWPVVHAPTFDMEKDSLALTATVCMIGTWFQSPLISMNKFYALRLHELLLQRFLQDIVDSKSFSSNKILPIDFFQAVLLNLVFSLYRTDEIVLTKTLLLRSLFITYLKQVGLFSSTALNTQRQRYCPGTRPLYELQTQDKYKKAAALTFHLDAYLALAYEQPPILHRQELDVELTSTFGLWNTFGIDHRSRRLSEEPVGRTASTISEMTKSPDSLRSSPLLIEDIQLGLCGLLQSVWVLAESCSSKANGYLSTDFQKVLLIEILDSWKRELDRSKDSISTANITTKEAKLLLLAYRGEDDLATSSLERIAVLIRDSMVLYYYSKICTCSELQISKKGVLIEQTSRQTWKTSKYGRAALVCALEMLNTVEGFDPSVARFNPLIRHGLTMCANLTKELVSEQMCDCQMQRSRTNIALCTQMATGVDAPVVVGGVLICVCNLDTWMARFEKVLKCQKAIAE